MIRAMAGSGRVGVPEGAEQQILLVRGGEGQVELAVGVGNQAADLAGVRIPAIVTDIDHICPPQ